MEIPALYPMMSPKIGSVSMNEVARSLLVEIVALPYSSRVRVTVLSLMATAVTSLDSFNGVLAGARSLKMVNVHDAPGMDWRVGSTSHNASYNI